MNTELVGWTMLHFLWLGGALLLVATVVRLALRRAGANLRYAHSLVTLLALAALPVAIGAWLANSNSLGGWGRSAAQPPAATELMPFHDSEATPAIADAQPEIIELNPDYIPGLAAEPEAHRPPPSFAEEGEIAGHTRTPTLTLPLRGRGPDLPPPQGESTILPPPEGEGRGGGGSMIASTLERALVYIQTAVPYLPYLWLLGTPVTFALLATGLIGAERMRRNGALITDGPIYEACERLRGSLRISRRVALAVCDRVAQPVLVGIVRPLILLPPAALAGWSPEQLEMVLLHELAHVRRWDNLVNLGQRVIESLLFFHPAVWIASTWVRRDREDCCDAVVVTRTQEPKQYAELLIALASPQPYAGLAMARHPLAGRLRRILKLEDEPMLVSRNTIGLLVLGVVAIALVVVSGPLRVQGEGKPVEEATEGPFSPSSEKESELAADVPKSLDARNVVDETDDPTESSTEESITVVYDVSNSMKERNVRNLLRPYIEIGHASLKMGMFENGPTILAITSPTEVHTKIEKIVGKGIATPSIIYDVPKALQESFPELLDSLKDDEYTYVDVQWNGPKPLVTAPGSVHARIQELVFAASPGRQASGERDDGTDAKSPLLRLADNSLIDNLDYLRNEVFKKSIENPDTTETYSVPTVFHDQLRQVFDGIRHDPYGPKLPFETKWNGDDTVQVMAPKAAHDVFFAMAIPELVALMQKQENARNAKESTGEAFDPFANALAGITYPSPREGDIAARAWEELELKIAPATDADLERARKKGFGGGLKVVGGKVNLNDGPVIMATLQGVDIEDFSDLEKALDEIRAINPSVVKWTGMHGENRTETQMVREQQGNANTPPGFRYAAGDIGSPANPGVNFPASSDTYTRAYSVPDNKTKSAAIELLNKWIESENLKNIILNEDVTHDKRVTITATEAQHERIAKVLTDVSPKLPFLSLEDQKIADRAYKLLGIELEPLSREELAGVKHHGFESGLRIANTKQESGILAGDLLVGLHIWPTSDLKSVDTILSRDDLSHLDPLKYYVIRHPNNVMRGRGWRAVGEAEKQSLESYSLASGRIRLDLPKPRKTSSLNSTPGVRGRMVYESNADGTTVGRMIYEPVDESGTPRVLYGGPGTNGPVTTPTPVTGTQPLRTAEPAAPNSQPTASPWAESPINPPTLRKPQPSKQPAPANLPSWPSTTDNSNSRPVPSLSSPLPPMPRPAGSEGKLSAVLTPAAPMAPSAPEPSLLEPPIGLDPTRPSTGTSPVPAEKSPYGPSDVNPTTMFRPPSSPAPAIRNPNSEIRNPQPVYRYDGKTFETWRDTWKHELSTEKRIEAVKALAAFGRAGYAKEAAETILDVAGEYDFTAHLSNEAPEAKLRSAIVYNLAVSPYRLDESIWFPMLMKRFNEKPDQWKGLMSYVLSSIQRVDEKYVEQIDALTENSDARLRSSALEALESVDRVKYRERIAAALRDSDTGVVMNALRFLDRQLELRAMNSKIETEKPWSNFPTEELVKLLFHSDSNVRSHTRNIFQNRSREPALQLEAFLNDPAHEDDWLLAVRAAGFLGTNFGPNLSVLEKFYDETEDLELKVATAIAASAYRGSNSTLLKKLRQEHEENEQLEEMIMNEIESQRFRR